MHYTQVNCCEFGYGNDANAWRKSTKEADNTQIFYCNLESKNLSMHWRHHGTNSRQRSSDWMTFLCSVPPW